MRISGMDGRRSLRIEATFDTGAAYTPCLLACCVR